MERLLIVGLGGALGSMARYGAGLAAARLAPGAAWPWATLSVNVIGGLRMGLLVGWLFRRWGRVTPLVVTHTLLDIGAFVGYAALAGNVSWLPT